MIRDVLTEKSLKIINTLEQNGFEAYAVGGCVRDSVMGNSISDVDFATNAKPCEIKHIFDSYTTINIGQKYGTIAVVIDGETFEITTYRADNGYSDLRHPDSVSFSDDLKSDLERRDFTINAMAYSKKTGIIDIFGGIDDIKNKTIRCVGEPEKRFSEDALRIMRALRFASTLGFELEENTKTAVFECAYLLEKVSSERLRDEFVKLICGKNATSVLIEYAKVLSVFIPEIEQCLGFCQHSRYHKYDVFEHIAYAVGAAPDNENARLSAFFHDIAKPECFDMDADGAGHFKGHASVCSQATEIIMKRLRFSAKQIELVKNVVALHSDANYTEKVVKRRVAKLGFDGFNLLLDLQCADNSAKHDFCKERLTEFEKWRKYAKELEEKDACVSVKKLQVNGYDMISLGFSGVQIGKILDRLCVLVMDEEIENNYDTLILKACELKRTGFI